MVLLASVAFAAGEGRQVAITILLDSPLVEDEGHGTAGRAGSAVVGHRSVREPALSTNSIAAQIAVTWAALHCSGVARGLSG